MNNYSTHFWTTNFTFFFFSFPSVFSSENLKYTEYDTHTEIAKRYFCRNLGKMYIVQS